MLAKKLGESLALASVSVVPTVFVCLCVLPLTPLSFTLQLRLTLTPPAVTEQSGLVVQ